MRLRLEVLRHELPPTRLLWKAQSTQQTVAELLEQLNDLVPLEAEGWGLEGYAVQVGNYEGLHFMRLGDVFKDEDEVVLVSAPSKAFQRLTESRIRPLQTNDIRARNLAGRNQISADGRRLIDGIAFGRPMLKRPTRPVVHIPPLKRAHALINENERDDEEEDENEDDPGFIPNAQLFERLKQSLQEEGAFQKENRNPGDDPDFSPKLRLLEGLMQSIDQDEGTRGGGSGRDGVADARKTQFLKQLLSAAVEEQRPRKRQRVALGDAAVRDDYADMFYDQSEDEENDEDFSVSDDESDEGSESSVSAASWNGISSGATTPKPITTGQELVLANGDDSSSNESWSAASSPTGGSGSESEDSSDSEPDELPSTNVSQSNIPSREAGRRKSDRQEPSFNQGKTANNISPPYQGKSRTHLRNARRRDTKKLMYLVRTGVLPSNSTRASFLEWQEAQDNSVDKEMIDEVEPGKYEVLDVDGATTYEEDEHAGHDDQEEESGLNQTGHLAETQLTITTNIGKSSEVSDLSEEAVDGQGTTATATQEFQQKRAALLAAIASGGIDVSTEQGQPAVMADSVSPSVGPRRAKLDVASSRRLLFGSLGVRAPKTEAERETLQKKLAAQGHRKTITKDNVQSHDQSAANVEAAEPTEDDPNAWKTKINLTAVECCDDDVELSTPPFPFYQRWDPSQWISKKRKRDSSAYKAPKGQNKKAHVDSYHANGEDDTLDYDDPEDEGLKEADDYEYDTADGQLLRETAQVAQDDLPPLPPDLSTLPAASLESIADGDVITFSRLEVSATTNWQPSQSPIRTATVLGKDGSSLDLRLASRDLQEHEYDDEGNRVYRKFEMEGHEEDDGLLTADFAELLDPRVLVKAHVEVGTEA